jgi:hypothetical protein
MKRRLYALFLGLGLLLSFFATARLTGAALGEYADTIQSDRMALSAVRGPTTEHNRYSVHEFVSGATAVREYVSSFGIVFGIAWNGLIHPDLDQLLGSYAGEYHKALQKTPRKPGQRSIRFKTDSVVVEKWGHMRNLQGRAYVPALIPSGVSVDEIR